MQQFFGRGRANHNHKLYGSYNRKPSLACSTAASSMFTLGAKQTKQVLQHLALDLFVSNEFKR
eukprot:3313244-Amphidinium_carterae.1